MSKITLETFSEVASEVNGGLYYKYSGRCMYSKTCIGISCADLVECIEVAASKGIIGAKYDSLGRDYIVYYPEYDFDNPDDETEDEVQKDKDYKNGLYGPEYKGEKF